ncbi:progestin and adipoQ receptor family member 4 [Agrilus planipennis]|uniref:Progestin and adipoQ receptor family member 4 n=1 Tax=Agrilus planipennis TaxID=224129 RepID=A0A1W4XQN8_AGRPL|nr:progestin and adipoQ receptor family member 4 [Agrilus planipennis]
MCASNSEITQHIQNISLVNNVIQDDPTEILKLKNGKKECDNFFFIKSATKQVENSEEQSQRNSSTKLVPQKKFEDIIEETVLKAIPLNHDQAEIPNTKCTDTSESDFRTPPDSVPLSFVSNLSDGYKWKGFPRSFEDPRIYKRTTKGEEENNFTYKGLPASAQEKLPKESCDENKKKNIRLLKWKDMPVHLQFNPYIRTGYRPMLSAWGCIRSLFYIHNETFNIVTHGMPILYIILKTPSITNWASSELQVLSWCHVAGIISPWIGSFTYHLFMNMNRDQHFYHRLLQLDMLGIWICQSIGAMPMVFTFSHCFEKLTKWLCISFYCLVALWGLYKAMLAISPWERRLCFILPFSLRILLCGFRFLHFGGGDPNALLHLLLQDFIAVIGAIIGALHIPEKWFPGHMDKCLNSHNIMHLFVVAAVYSMHEATMQDLKWINEVQCISEQLF